MTKKYEYRKNGRIYRQTITKEYFDEADGVEITETEFKSKYNANSKNKDEKYVKTDKYYGYPVTEITTYWKITGRRKPEQLQLFNSTNTEHTIHDGIQ